MSEYKVVSRKPTPRLTSDKNSYTPHANESECVREIIKIGISEVKAISGRSKPGLKFARLDGPGYLKLWKEYARQKSDYLQFKDTKGIK